MARFVLVPGAGGASWYWHRVVPLLRERGHEAEAVDLPGPDPTAGLPEYSKAIETALGDGRDTVVVAQSLGGFSAVMACASRPVHHLAFLNAMVPRPGETPGEWFEHTGAEEARVGAAEAGGWGSDFDPFTHFLHDVPPEVVASGEERQEAAVVFAQPCDVSSWPDVSTTVLVGRDDRFFPADFQVGLAKERLGVVPEVIPGGHLAALSRPDEVVACVLRLPG